MPKLLEIMGYQVSIWSNENGEPIHIHLSKRKPTKNSFKLWLTSDGNFVKAVEKDKRISDIELSKIIKKLKPQAQFIRDCWVAYHGYEKYIR